MTFHIMNKDTLGGLAEIASESIDMILSDIPYGIDFADWDTLHDNRNKALGGASSAQKKKPGFKRRGKPINGWSKADKKIPYEYYEWCSSWASEWLRVLKPGGSAVVFAGRRLAHRFICAMEDCGFNTKDLIAWEKPSALLKAQRLSIVYERREDKASAKLWDGWRVGNLRPIFEPIVWCVKPYTGTIADNAIKHGLGAFNLSAYQSTGSDANMIKTTEKISNRTHPAQKPTGLLAALIKLCTKEDSIILDPFCGTGSTLVAAVESGRTGIGIEIDEEHCQSARAALAELDKEKT